MKKFLICVATEIEIDNKILPLLNSNTVCIETLVTGMGIPATIYSLSKKISNNKYDFIINIGIAGSFTESLSMGEVVEVVEDCFADLGVDNGTAFIPLTTIENKANFFSNTPKTNLFKARGITVNTVTGTTLRKNWLKNQYLPHIETMESAAIFYVCQNENIPFLVLRSISNEVGQRNKQYWNIPLAVKNLWLTLSEVFHQLL